MELTLPRLPSVSGEDLNSVSGLYSIPESEKTDLCPSFSGFEAPETALQLPGSPSPTDSLEKSSLAIYCLHLSDQWDRREGRRIRYQRP